MAFCHTDDCYEITARFIETLDKNIDMNNPGTLNQLISEEDAIKLSSLTISGSINADDISFINQCCPSLKSLDLGKAQVMDLVDDDGNILAHSNVLPRSALSGYHLSNLETLILPESLEKLGDYSIASFHKLKSITIPKGVYDYGTETFYYTLFLDTICVLNPEPVLIDPSVLRDTRCPENGTLYVPVGSAEKYKQAAVWKDFKNIIEGEIPAGIENIVAPDSEQNGLNVFSIDGIQMLKNASKEDLNQLSDGVYIIREGNRSRKVIIRK